MFFPAFRVPPAQQTQPIPCFPLPCRVSWGARHGGVPGQAVPVAAGCEQSPQHLSFGDSRSDTRFGCPRVTRPCVPQVITVGIRLGGTARAAEDNFHPCFNEELLMTGHPTEKAKALTGCCSARGVPSVPCPCHRVTPAPAAASFLQSPSPRCHPPPCKVPPPMGHGAPAAAVAGKKP